MADKWIRWEVYIQTDTVMETVWIYHGHAYSPASVPKEKVLEAVTFHWDYLNPGYMVEFRLLGPFDHVSAAFKEEIERG